MIIIKNFIKVMLVIIFLPIALPIILILGLSKIIEPTDKKHKYTDKELDAYGLLNFEKEEVRKGNYEPWQFSEPGEEELEDDDYYYDN